jgi:hypothetical protein
MKQVDHSFSENMVTLTNTVETNKVNEQDRSVARVVACMDALFAIDCEARNATSVMCSATAFAKLLNSCPATLPETRTVWSELDLHSTNRAQ